MTESSLTSQEKRTIHVHVNGIPYTAQVETRLLLCDFLRHKLHLTGTHVGCEHGVCGACTIIFNGAPIRSCLMLAVQADGAEILTVEGLAHPDGTFHPLQQAFHDYHGLQCGFCTPGFLMAIYAFLQDNPDPNISDEAIREAISGNLCRCTGYQGIVAAVRHVLTTPSTTRRGRFIAPTADLSASGIQPSTADLSTSKTNQPTIDFSASTQIPTVKEEAR